MPGSGLRIVIFLLCVGALSTAVLVSFRHQGRQELQQQEQDYGICTSSAGPGRTRQARDQGAGGRAAGKVAVIYYGWLIDEHGQPNADARRLAAGKPDMIVAAPYTDHPRRNNLPISVRALFREAHTQVAIYIATNYGHRPLNQVQSAIADAAANGDGIFLDEVVATFDSQTWAYYAAIAAQARSAGLTVIANPGLTAIDERIMDIVDIVMLEHQWVQFASGCRWCVKYPPDRFMGVSSNEPGAAKELGHVIDAQQAEADTRRAWALGVGWHYSCDRYTELPPWYGPYMRRVRAMR